MVDRAVLLLALSAKAARHAELSRQLESILATRRFEEA